MTERKTDALDAIGGEEIKENVINTGTVKSQDTELSSDPVTQELCASPSDEDENDFFAAAKRRKAERQRGGIFEKYKIITNFDKLSINLCILVNRRSGQHWMHFRQEKAIRQEK